MVEAVFPSYNAIANPPEAAVGGLLEVREGQRYDSAHQPEATVRNVEVDSRMHEAGFRNTRARAHTHEPDFCTVDGNAIMKLLLL